MSDVDVDAHVAAVARDGYTIVEDAIDAALVDELLASLDHLVSSLGVVPADNDFEGRSTLRVYNLLVHGEIWQRVPLHPVVLPIVEGVLDRGCLISSLSSIDIRPGEMAQPIHADDQLIPLPKPHPPLVCNTMWALTDFTEASGATRLAPGTHLAEASPHYGRHYDSVAAEMPRGSVLVWHGSLWHGSLWHGGGANRSSARRVGVAMNYCAGFVRQQENQQLGIPQTLVRTFPRRLQELVGYGVYNGLIGHIDRRSPVDLLAAGSSDHRMVWDAVAPE